MLIVKQNKQCNKPHLILTLPVNVSKGIWLNKNTAYITSELYLFPASSVLSSSDGLQMTVVRATLSIMF